MAFIYLSVEASRGGRERPAYESSSHRFIPQTGCCVLWVQDALAAHASRELTAAPDCVLHCVFDAQEVRRVLYPIPACGANEAPLVDMTELVREGDSVGGIVATHACGSERGLADH